MSRSSQRELLLARLRRIGAILNVKVVALALCGLHVLLVFRHFPPSHFIDDVLITSGDFHFHAGACAEARELLGSGGLFWGYSPYRMAGYPMGAWTSLGRRLYEFAAVVSPFASVARVFYGCVVLMALLPPFLVWATFRVLGFVRRVSWIGLSVAIIVWQFDSMASGFWRWGLITFPFANCLALLSTATFSRALATRSASFLWLAASLAVLIFYIHPLALLPAGLGCLFAVAAFPRAPVSRPLFGHVCLAACVASALVLTWGVLLWRFHALRRPVRVIYLQAGVMEFLWDFFTDRGYVGPAHRRVLFHVQFVLSILGSVCLLQRKDKVASVVAGTALACLTLAYSLGIVPLLRQCEPYRYVVSFALFGVVPAAVGADRLFFWFKRSNVCGRLLASVIALCLMPSLTAYIVDTLCRSPGRGSTHGLDQEQRAVVSWIQGAGAFEGRILCQDEVLGDVLPFLVKREVIGGLLSKHSVLQHGYVSVGREEFFFRTAAETDCEFVGRQLRLFNVAVAVVEKGGFLAEILSDLSRCERVWGNDRFSIFELADSSPILGRDAPDVRVVSAMNRIRIENAPSGSFTLKYHHMDGLTAPDGVVLRPVIVEGASLPFIQVDNPRGLASITIKNKSVLSELMSRNGRK